NHQEAGVRRDDAELRAQADDLFLQLFVFALQVDLVHQVAHAAHGPHARQVSLAGVGDGQLNAVFKGTDLAVDHAFQHQSVLAGLVETAEHGKLRAGKDVAGDLRVQVVHLCAVDAQLDVGQD